MPEFRYHPDPVATGSAVPDDVRCSVCGSSRGVRYTGPVYGVGADEPALCLHCIASGEASRALGTAEIPADFTDAAGAPGEVPRAVVEEVTRRTPGFAGWQQERWLYHCADAAAFLGPAGFTELVDHPEALDELRRGFLGSGWPADQTDAFLRALDRDGAATAYLFRCLHCGTHLAYWDTADTPSRTGAARPRAATAAAARAPGPQRDAPREQRGPVRHARR